MIFFKKETLRLKTDLHSHLLPGIDDGSKSLRESVDLIKKYINLGYEKLIITPHVMSDTYNNSTEKILKVFKLLKEEIKKENLNISLEISAEYYMDEEFVKRLENNDILSINNKYILFETSYYEKPFNFEDIIFRITSKGYIPILAHPERYRYVNDLNFYQKIKDLGVKFQCNINSFGGFYGKTVQKKIQFLAKNKMIDFLGSDCHSMKYLEFMQNVLNNRKFLKLIKNNNIENNLL